MGINIGEFTPQSCEILDRIPCGEYTIEDNAKLQDSYKKYRQGKLEVKNGE